MIGTFHYEIDLGTVSRVLGFGHVDRELRVKVLYGELVVDEEWNLVVLNWEDSGVYCGVLWWWEGFCEGDGPRVRSKLLKL